MKKIEMIGILLSMAGVLVIAFSKEAPEFKLETEFVHPIWPIMSLITALILIVVRYTIFKYETHRVPDSIANSSVLRSLVTVTTGIPILLVGLIYWGIAGLITKYLMLGIFAGIIANVAANFGLLATVMGKGGPATAVIETAMIF